MMQTLDLKENNLPILLYPGVTGRLTTKEGFQLEFIVTCHQAYLRIVEGKIVLEPQK